MHYANALALMQSVKDFLLSFEITGIFLTYVEL